MSLNTFVQNRIYSEEVGNFEGFSEKEGKSSLQSSCGNNAFLSHEEEENKGVTNLEIIV